MDIFEPLRELMRPLAPGERGLYRLMRSQGEPEQEVSDDPFIQYVMDQIQQMGYAAELYDTDWNLRWCSAELRLLLGEERPEVLGYGEHVLDVYQRPVWAQTSTVTSQEHAFIDALPYVAHDTPGGMKAVRKLLPESMRAQAKGLQAQTPPPMWVHDLTYVQGALPPVRVWCLNVRLYADDVFRGTLRLYGPGLRASVLALVARGDERMFDRMTELFVPGPRRCAILFADLEDSTGLSRRLSSAAYFDILSALMKAIDDEIVNHAGVVGKHVGDGASAFFISDFYDEPGCEAAAAVETAHAIRKAAAQIARKATRATRTPVKLPMNIGLHWGSTIYMGQIVTGGRLEITALGDQVNECARIEQAARGGIILGSKQLVERIPSAESARLGLRPQSLTYADVSTLPGAPPKSQDVHLPVTTLYKPPKARAKKSD